MSNPSVFCAALPLPAFPGLFVVNLLPEIHLADDMFFVPEQLLAQFFGDLLQHQVEHRLAVLEVGDPRLILPGLGQKTLLLPIGQK